MGGGNTARQGPDNREGLVLTALSVFHSSRFTRKETRSSTGGLYTVLVTHG